MPIYEYECTSCHHHFDVIQKINEEPVNLCPACSKQTVIKLISAAGFQLKGTGWYATDFKNSGKPSTPDNKVSTENKNETKTPSDSKGDSIKSADSVTKESTPKTTSTADK